MSISLPLQSCEEGQLVLRFRYLAVIWLWSLASWGTCQDKVLVLPPLIAEPIPAPLLPAPPPLVHVPGEVQLPPLLPSPPKPAPKVWTGGVELGLSGAEGNSDNFKFRLGVNTKAQTDYNMFKLDANYAYTNVNGTDNENRGLTKARHEWLKPGSPWSIFLAGEIEYDEFKAFDVRLAGHSGLAYLFVKNDTMLFKGRAGAGASREIGGPSNDTKPEMLFGFDFEYKLTSRQKLTFISDFYPTFNNLNDYRYEGRLSWEILVDPTWNLTLKFGILDRYDSTPEGKRPNDYDYYATMLWKF